MGLALVKSVDKNSIASDANIQPGDIITKVDDQKITDILDFKFLTSSDYYVVSVLKKDGTEEEIEIYNDEFEDFGVQFENQLIDEPKRCQNKCIFCFMDQLPKNMRKTMYFKDDDVRLSFLQGNYVTLTNLNEDDINRIIRLRISPINISVHATDVSVRKMMLNNKNAGLILDIMKRFAAANIYMNCQIVLCKGINDGKILEKTIEDLSGLFPYVRSISVVPVGISKHRDGLYKLESFTKEDLCKVIDSVNLYREKFLKKFSKRLLYLSDEFYIGAFREIPEYEEYEDFPQIENGVGMVASFKKEVYDRLNEYTFEKNKKISKKTVVTSYIMDDIINKTIRDIEKVSGKLPINTVKIKNNFFGEKITVTGLICGCDITEQLKGKDLGEYLLLSDTMIKDGTDLFLDDITLSDIENQLGIKVILVKEDGSDFIDSLII